MKRARGPHRRARSRPAFVVAAVVVLLGALALSLALSLPGSTGVRRAAGQTSGGEVTPQTDDAVPARGVVMIGSSPSEAPDETWGIGEIGSLGSGSWAIVRYDDNAGWSRASWLDVNGHPPSGVVLKPDSSPLAGRVTSSGAGALLATVTAEGQPAREVVLVRSPGHDFAEAPPVPAEGEAALLKPGERLFSLSRAPLVAALDEAGGRAGALVVPVNSKESGVEEDGVLHWDGSGWTREQIEVPEVSKEHKDFRVLAIGASSPGSAWLLAQLSQQAEPGAVALFRRRMGSPGPPTWEPVVQAPGGKPGERLTAEGEPFTVTGPGEPPTAAGQILTVTDEGVWIDGERADVPATMFFKPEGKEAKGEVRASWCNAPSGSSPCKYALPDSLPVGRSRSFAWADPANAFGFGERVVTGLGEGVSLRLEGSSFMRVLALGADEQGFLDVGGSRGAAFSSPWEGWLGNERMPVHLTQHPAPNRLTPYPVPFRHPLLALAPQPGAPVASLSSQALAVGEQGEVARYTPGQGWQPESLFGAGGRVVKGLPLRAVAWPTSTRAYAVGQLDSRGDPQMWLWRGETGLWEPDPAAPRNFRGQLLGIAFDPNNPARGYAVGQGGVLLRYGKSWTQDALPSEVAGASFTSIAFAGSQAIVAYRVPHPQGGGEGAHYTGGLLVNDGAGWQVDQSAAAALGGSLPWAVAALPDGGAAVSGSRDAEPIVLERDNPGAPWQPTAAPYPGFEAPGSLSLFREGGALRVVGSGGIPDTNGVDFGETPPPSNFPPNLIKPYPPAAGYVLRQTAVGWSDEEHDRDEVGSPCCEPKQYDKPYQPDPSSAVLVDSSGTRGWAVGGVIDSTGRLETADISRYPADGVPPPGFAAAPVAVSGATFAVGGGAQCAAPCADRANAGIGPDAWLSSALGQAGQIAGVRAFLYTGPRVTAGEGRVHPVAVPRDRELARYAELMRSSTLPAFVAASPTDRGAGGECLFEQVFAGFPAPFGTAALTAPGLANAGGSAESCASGSAGYYALDTTGSGGPVRVIVLDDASEVGDTQRLWLEGELAGAKALKEPAIVLGNADLNAQIAAGDGQAAAVARALAAPGTSASAYFYDSPQHNVALPLRVGASSIPTFGSGTLGYMDSRTAQKQDFTGHAGFLLAEVESARRDSNTNIAPVHPVLIPNIGELALEAKDGVLLRRSNPALFNGLARRPRAGCLATGTELNCETSPYIPIPANCIGSVCTNAILPEYSFSSSRPDIGDFVALNQASPDPRAVLLGPNDKPIPDAHSSLFCAYNAGSTVVTISAGGLSASLLVTVQAGSVRRPCGTQPLKELPPQQQAASVAPPPAPAPAPAGPAPAATPSPVPLPQAPSVASPTPAHASPAPASAPFFLAPAPVTPLLAIVPLPVPTPARPTPPSGTSPVTSPVEAPEREEEEEEATESVGNNAVAYKAPEHEPTPAYLLGIVVLAAFAGASARRRPRRGRREVRVAPATLSTARTQRRIGAARRRYP